MDISQVDTTSGEAPQSNVPQAPILIRPTEGGQSVDGLLPTAPLAPNSMPSPFAAATPSQLAVNTAPAPLPAAVPAPPSAPSVAPASSPVLEAAPQPVVPAPVAAPAPPSPAMDFQKPAPPVPGGVAPSTVVIDKVFETPADAKAQMVSQVPEPALTAPDVPVPAPASKPKKPSLPVLIGLIAGGIILIAGVTFITISMLSKKPVTSKTPTVSLTQPVTMNSSDIIGTVSKAVAGSTTTTSAVGPAYQVAKSSYGVTPPADAAVTYPVANAAAAVTLSAKIVPLLTSNGLKDRSVSTATTATSATSSGIFDATGTHCKLTSDAKTVLLACTNTKTYEDLTSKLQPVYTVFTTARPVDKAKQPQTLSLNRWTTSKTQGYTIADLAVTDVTVGAVPVSHLLYQSPDKTWHYVGETLSTTGCGNFNTADLKKAFLGELCMNGTTKATVVLQ